MPPKTPILSCLVSSFLTGSFLEIAAASLPYCPPASCVLAWGWLGSSRSAVRSSHGPASQPVHAGSAFSPSTPLPTHPGPFSSPSKTQHS